MPPEPSPLADKTLADWSAVEAACREFCTTLAWECVYKHTSDAIRAQFRRSYRWTVTGRPEREQTAMAGDEELYDIAYDAILGALVTLEKNVRAGRLAFINTAQLYTYFRNGVVGFTTRDGRFLAGRFPRLVRARLRLLGSHQTLEPECAPDQSGNFDADAVISLRQQLAIELQDWNIFAGTLNGPNAEVADAVAMFLIARLRAACPEGTSTDLRAIEARWARGYRRQSHVSLAQPNRVIRCVRQPYQ
jgi:hypothetical protein